MSDSFEKLTDEELLDRIKSNDHEALDTLLVRYKGFAAARARSLFLMGGDRDDLLQETMIGLLKAVRSYDASQGASFKTFAGLVVDRHLSTIIRDRNNGKNRALNNYVSFDAEEDEKSSELAFAQMCPDPTDDYVEKDNYRWMMEKLRENLSAFELEVLQEYLKDDDYNHVAEKLGKAPKSIDNALQRIKKKLKELNTI